MDTVRLIVPMVFCFFLFGWAGRVKDRSTGDEWKRIGSFVEVVMSVSSVVGIILVVATLGHIAP